MDFEKIFISEKMIGKRLARSTLVPIGSLGRRELNLIGKVQNRLTPPNSPDRSVYRARKNN